MTVGRLLIAGLVILGSACSSDPEIPTYELKGQILVVKPETNEVLVKHEDIKGFMPAMTMPYTVKDTALLKDRVPGDLITATLHVASDGPYLSNINKTGTAPLPDDARSDIPPAANVHLLKAGDPLPATPLVDQGRSITFADFKGSALAVTFIYTRCPLANFCPLLDRRFAEVQKIAASDPALAGKVRLLSISFDPAFDTDASLKAHAEKLGADPNVWRFATAEQAVVDRLAAEFGINVIREKDGTITHNLRTAIVDPSGRVTSILDNNAWSAGELAAGLKNALAAPR
ncbi:MAG TPA: SCO family protein [Vicinamibacterales bacterium]|nr:SCO family protein [Vicinamibacterales bacterium]